MHRLAAAVFSIWFVLVMVEPAALHSCPVHGDHGSESVAPAVESGAHAGHDAPARSEHDHAGCTCPGTCAGAGSASAVPAAVIVIAPPPAARTTIGTHAALLRAPARPPFVLPFANGPPALPRPA
jgi:hypothetical protein